MGRHDLPSESRTSRADWLSSSSSRGNAASETPVEDMRQKVGALLELLLDEKAKNLGSIFQETLQIRYPCLRRGTTGLLSKHAISSTSSGDSTILTHQNTLDQGDSLDPDDLEWVKSLKVTAMRGSAYRPTCHQARVVESETNEQLPIPNVMPQLQLPLDPMRSFEPSFVNEWTSLCGNPASMSLPFISYNDLVVQRELGRGQFASVKLTLWKGVQVALKEWHTLTDRESMDMAFQEGRSLACLRHPCVVSFYGILNEGPSPGLIVEYLPHGSLKSKLQELKGTNLDNKQLKVTVALRAARGMEFLHSRKVIHFDLKCENLLCDLRDLENPVVKIGDVGLSKEKMKTFVSGNMRGTLPWMAPELFPSMQYVGSQGTIADRVNEKVDIYSFGVVLWEIWEMGEMPYPALDLAELLERNLAGNLKLECPEDCDPIWSEVMYECLSRNPNDRPDFSTIVVKLERLVEEDEFMRD